MKVIIAGCREGVRQTDIDQAVAQSGFIVTEVVSGTQRGADQLGENWAKTRQIPVRPFRPDWSVGRAAGPIRNRQMADYADALVAVWDGRSPGTRTMIQTAQRRGLRVYVYEIGPTLFGGNV